MSQEKPTIQEAKEQVESIQNATWAEEVRAQLALLRAQAEFIEVAVIEFEGRKKSGPPLRVVGEQLAKTAEEIHQLCRKLNAS